MSDRAASTPRAVSRCVARSWVAMAAAAASTSAAAQQLPVTRPDVPVVVGGIEDESARLRELLGDSARASPLARSASASTDPLAPIAWRARRAVVPLLPEIRVVHNSGLASGGNDGALWAGRGASAIVRGGAALRWGALRVVLLPEVAHARNRPFPIIGSADSTRSAFASPWHTGRYSADLPLRFGDAPLTLISPGQSSVTISFGPVGVGVSSENEWWGPGVRNALVLSNNAQGIPHLFARTVTPLRTRIGDVEARWLAGVLTESPYFDARPDDDHRSFAAALVTLRPSFDRGLTLGIERAVVAPVRRAGAFVGHAADPFIRWYGGRDGAAGDSSTVIPLFGLFGRWLFPAHGAEVYGEWTRAEFPRSLRDFVVAPQHTQAYTLGAARATRVATDRSIVVRVELTDLSQSRVLDDRPVPVDYYTAAVPAHGYTQRGQVIGAQAGPGGSEQSLSIEYVTGRWRAAVFGQRTRWENDALYRLDLRNPLRHDVSLAGGTRAAATFAAWEVRAELTLTNRVNYLFQNGGANLDGVRTVDLRNLQLAFDLAPRRR